MTNYTCDTCKNDLVVYEGQYSVYGYCPKCIKQKHIPLPNEACCRNPQIEPAKILMRGGGSQVRQHCVNCCQTFGLALKKDDFDLNNLKTVDENKRSEINNKIRIEYEKFISEFEKYFEEHDTLEFRFPGYTEYLKSEKWFDKRKLVLKRDNYICQSCLVKKAEQVHHLTYKHVFNEPLFDLISVCIECHNNITEIDRSKRT